MSDHDYAPALVEPLEHRRLLSGDLGGQDVVNPQVLIGLLLPAVQKVRDAANRTAEIADLHAVPENAQIGLLLPAVQKVQDAADRLNDDSR